MTKPTADTPVPRQLSEEERALWEKASAVRPTDRITQIDADFIEACSPAVILSLLTALSSEREAGEREADFCGAIGDCGPLGIMRCGKAPHSPHVMHFDADHLVTFSDSTTERHD